MTSAERPVIVILLGAPFTEQNYLRTGIPYLSRSCQVWLLDCTRWVAPGSVDIQFTQHPYEHYVRITSAAEFAQKIATMRPHYAIDFVGLGAHYRMLQDVLKRNHVKLVVQKTGNLPAIDNRKRLLVLFVFHPLETAVRFWRRIKGFGRKIELLAPDIALLAGKQSLDSWTRSARRILWVNSNDYNKFLAVRKFGAGAWIRPSASQYMVFLDDCLAMASDYALLGIQAPIEPSRYFALLRTAFDKLEKASGLPVIVAAHPNGKDIPDYSSRFGSRQVFFDRTPELAAGCTLAISHISTALSFAVLADKPVIIFTSKSLERSFYGAQIGERSRQLSCPLLRMEAGEGEFEKAWAMSREVNSKAYRAYVENYIVTADAHETEPWGNFLRYIEQVGP